MILPREEILTKENWEHREELTTLKIKRETPDEIIRKIQKSSWSPCFLSSWRMKMTNKINDFNTPDCPKLLNILFLEPREQNDNHQHWYDFEIRMRMRTNEHEGNIDTGPMDVYDSSTLRNLHGFCNIIHLD